MNQAVNSSANTFSVDLIIRLIKSYFWELIRFSWLILILAVLLGGYLYYDKSKEPTIYTSNYSMMLNQGSGTDQGYLQQVLGSGLLGFAGGSSDGFDGLGSSSNSQAAVLQELIHTRKIIQLALFEKVTIKYNNTPKTDYLIHHFIDLQGLRDRWIEEELPLKDFYFKHSHVDSFTREENSILKTVSGLVSNRHLSEQLSQTGIINIRFNSQNEQLAYLFSNVLFEKLNEYYTQQSIEKQTRIFQAAKSRRDSLEGVMEDAEAEYIRYLNRHNAPAKGTYAQTIETQFLARKLSGEMEAYFMAIKNTEAAKIALEQQRPLLQPIDKPIYPLHRDRPNAFFFLIIGAVAGGFLGVVIVLGRKALRDFLKAPKNNPVPTADKTIPTA